MMWEEMKEAVRRAAQRELDLDIGTKPINDPQILGECYDVRVEGRYLGWLGPKKCDELRQLYKDTPSRLHPVKPKEIDLDQLVTGIGTATKKCREIEADMMVATTPLQAGDAATQGIQNLRNRLEFLHEQVLLMQQEQRVG